MLAIQLSSTIMGKEGIMTSTQNAPSIHLHTDMPLWTARSAVRRVPSSLPPFPPPHKLPPINLHAASSLPTYLPRSCPCPPSSPCVWWAVRSCQSALWLSCPTQAWWPLAVTLRSCGLLVWTTRRTERWGYGGSYSGRVSNDDRLVMLAATAPALRPTALPPCRPSLLPQPFGPQ